MSPAGWLVGFVSLMLLAGALLFAYLAWDEYRALAARARSDAAYTARVVEEHTRWTIAGSNLVLQGIRDRVATVGLDAVVSGPADRKKLDELAASMPQIGSLWFFDASGEAVYSTSRGDVSGNFADRDYFRAHAAGTELFISPALLGRITGSVFFSVSRRLERDGAFAGVAMAAVDPNVFTGFHASLGLPAGSVLGVHHAELARMVIRTPLETDLVGRDLSGLPLFATHLAEVPAGTYEMPRSGTEREQFVAYRLLPDLPLVVAVQVPRREAMAPWRHALYRNLAFSLGGVGLVLALTFVGVRLMRREAQAKAALGAALAERELLFKEMHHRTKNNLQMVASLISLQAPRYGIPPAAVAETLARIRLIGEVHEQLHRTDSLSEVDCAAFLRSVADALARGEAEARGIAVGFRADPLRCGMDQAIALALILNEAITNCIKHAFAGRASGRIEATLSLLPDDTLRLEVRDDGVGLGEAEASGRGSLGLTLMRAMARKLRGELVLESGDGTCCTVIVPSWRCTA